MDRLAPKLQEVRFALLNKWQDECLPKSHDYEIDSLRPIVSSSIPDRNDGEYLSLRSTKADLVFQG
jgi:hypothetical protein